MSDEINRRELLVKGIIIASGLAATSIITANAQPSINGGDKSKPDKLHTKKVPPLSILKDLDTPEPSDLVEELSKNLSEIKETSASRNITEDEIWKDISNLVKSDFKLTTDNSLSTDLSSKFLRIESGFKFVEKVEDNDFRTLHVEPLLDQAANLLDRGIRDRAEWDDKAVKTLNLALELNEYDDLDKIHAQEEKAGFYEVEFKQSVAGWDAEKYIETQSYNSEKQIEEFIRNIYSIDQINKLHNATLKQAWLSGVAPYRFGEQVLKEYYKHDFGDGVPQTVCGHATSAAEILSLHGLKTQEFAIRLQRSAFGTERWLSDIRGKGVRRKKDWDEVNINFRKMRTKVARKYQDIKSKAATAPDGVLNYPKRMMSIQERFQQDFRDALARLKIVQLGLETIYGYKNPFPKNSDSIQYFDDCLLWARHAINWLTRFSRVDQSYVLPISLRNLTKQQWDDGLKKGDWEFAISENLFPDQRHVRLRGISAVVVETDNRRDIWQVTVRAPQTGAFLHLSSLVKIIVDQSSVPTCRLGRVSTRESIRQPDVVGVSALYNASPIGVWKVTINPFSIGGVKREKLEDIQLDLHLAMRAEPDQESNWTEIL